MTDKTDDNDEPTEKDLSREERAALKLARLPEAKLRKLSIKDLRRAYEAATDIETSSFLSDAEHARVTKVGWARHVDRIARPKTKSKKSETKEYRTDGLVTFKF